MSPYYDVFDNRTYRADGAKVTLFGQAARSTLKSDAKNVTTKIDGLSAQTTCRFVRASNVLAWRRAFSSAS